LKAKLRVHNKNLTVTQVVEGMQAKGIDITAETIRARSKSRKTLAELGEAQDKLAKQELGLSSDESVSDDEEMKAQEADTRGRKKLTKRKREKSIQPRDFGSDEDMREAQPDMTAVEALSKIKSRSYTPAQRSVSVKHAIRSKSKSRLEGSVPPRVIPVPEEQIRLAKKITKKAFGRVV
jgi:hypothetical protein